MPSAFTATTASAIGIGNGWFNAIGANNYSSLTGTPSSFAFLSNPSAIFNSGNLIVNAGQSLTLLGGTVVNTGTIAAPGGNITITAVPGENLVRITQEGSLLSLVLPIEARSAINASINSSLSLPALLTRGSISEAKGIVVENGVVKLVGYEVQKGDVTVTGGILGGTASLSGSNNLTLVESRVQTTGNLNLLAEDTVRVRDSATAPVSLLAGGNLQIRGNLGIDILASNYFQKLPQQFQASLFQSSGTTSLISNGSIAADGYFISNGLFSVQNLAGSAGNFSSRSGSTIFSRSDVTFNNYTGGTLWIQNLGNITSGDIKITAINPNIQSFPDPPKDPNNSAPIITKEPALVFKAGGDKASENSLANIRVGRIENATGKPIDIQGTGNIQINAIVSRGSTINICSNGCIPDRTTEEKGSITVLGNVDAGVGGSISLFAPDKITTQDLIAFLNPSVTQGNSGGFVTLRSSGNITTSSIQTGERGNINLTSTKGSIDTSQGQQISGGRIFLVALDKFQITSPQDIQSLTGGSIKTSKILGGSVSLLARGNISTRQITADLRLLISSFNGSIDTSSGRIFVTVPPGAIPQLLLGKNFSEDFAVGVKIRAAEDITTADLGVSDGKLIISSVNGSINTQRGELFIRGILDPSREIKLESKQSITTGNINSNGGRFTSASFANPLPLSSADLDQTGGAGQSAPFLPESPTFAIAQLSNPISEKPSIINQTTNSPPPETKQKVSDTPSVDPCRYNNSVLDVRTSSDLAVDDLDIVAGQLVDSNQFIQCFEQTLARAKEQKNVNAEELALYNLGVLMFRLGDYLRSRGYYEQNISLLNSLGSSRQSYPQVKRISLSGLGTVYSALGVYPKAIYLYNESLNILPQNRDANLLDNPRIRAFIQRSLGVAYLNQGEIEQSQEKFNKSVFYQTILRTVFEAEAETRILPLYVTS